MREEFLAVGEPSVARYQLGCEKRGASQWAATPARGTAEGADVVAEPVKTTAAWRVVAGTSPVE